MDLQGYLTEYFHMSQQMAEQQIGSTSKQMYIGYIQSYDPERHMVTVLNPMNVVPTGLDPGQTTTGNPDGTVQVSPWMPLFSFMTPTGNGINPLTQQAGAYGFQYRPFGGASLANPTAGEAVLVLDIAPGIGYSCCAILLFNNNALPAGQHIPVSNAQLNPGEMLVVQPAGQVVHFDNAGNFKMYAQKLNGAGGNINSLAEGGFSFQAGGTTPPGDADPGDFDVATTKNFNVDAGFDVNVNAVRDISLTAQAAVDLTAGTDVNVTAQNDLNETATSGDVNLHAIAGSISENAAQVASRTANSITDTSATTITQTAGTTFNEAATGAFTRTGGTITDVSAGNFTLTTNTGILSILALILDIIINAARNVQIRAARAIAIGTQILPAAFNTNTILITNVPATPAPTADNIGILAEHDFNVGAVHDITIAADNNAEISADQDVRVEGDNSVVVTTKAGAVAGALNSILVSTRTTATPTPADDIQVQAEGELLLNSVGPAQLSSETDNTIIQAHQSIEVTAHERIDEICVTGANTGQINRTSDSIFDDICVTSNGTGQIKRYCDNVLKDTCPAAPARPGHVAGAGSSRMQQSESIDYQVNGAPAPDAYPDGIVVMRMLNDGNFFMGSQRLSDGTYFGILATPDVEASGPSSLKVYVGQFDSNFAQVSLMQRLVTEDWLLNIYSNHTHSGVTTGASNSGTPNFPIESPDSLTPFLRA